MCGRRLTSRRWTPSVIIKIILTFSASSSLWLSASSSCHYIHCDPLLLSFVIRIIILALGDLLPSLQLWRLCRSDTRRLGQMARKGAQWGQLWKWEAQGMLPVDWTSLRRSNSCTPHSFRAAGSKTLLCCWVSSESVLFLSSCSAMLLLIEGRLMWFILYNILRGVDWNENHYILYVLI